MRTEPGVGHLDEEALVLHYFGEDKGATREAAERHLATCEACRDELESNRQRTRDGIGQCAAGGA